MNVHEIRLRSLRVASDAGIRVPQSLPEFEDPPCVRSETEAVTRLLCLHAVAAASFGFEKARAVDWLRQEGIERFLTGSERLFLGQNVSSASSFQLQVEGLWALAWALCVVPELDYWKQCDRGFVFLLPNLKTAESGTKWRTSSRLRPISDLIAACDLAYCLHWAIRQAELEGAALPVGLQAYVVIERRRALEWLLSDDDWDTVSLDT